jgi:hypothetical protein
LSLRNGGGRLLVWCFAGCDSRNILAELRRRGLLGGRNADHRIHDTTILRNRDVDDTKRITWALDGIWREARSALGTPVERYLRSRGIDPRELPAEVLSSLRYHPRCRRPKDDYGNRQAPLPAMVALVQRVQRGPVAVACTYLRPGGTGKANVPKKQQRAFFGPVAGGAVRFGSPLEGEWLAVGEGIETVLSVAASCGLPAWAALSTSGIRNLVLPPEARMILLCVDHDENGAGQAAARDAAQQFLHEDRRVRLALPPIAGTDFNDMLRNPSIRVDGEVRHE